MKKELKIGDQVLFKHISSNGAVLKWKAEGHRDVINEDIIHGRIIHATPDNPVGTIYSKKGSIYMVEFTNDRKKRMRLGFYAEDLIFKESKKTHRRKNIILCSTLTTYEEAV